MWRVCEVLEERSEVQGLLCGGCARGETLSACSGLSPPGLACESIGNGNL